MTLSAGSKLGPYEIVGPLGAGGMGEVYRARDTRLDRTVAIKVLLSRLSRDPELKERFDREARAIASLNHPHICVLHDVGTEGEIDYLVMECLEGEALSDLIARGPLPTAGVLRYGIEIADALTKAHRQGIAHRDLKPGNVMITKAGAKLLDFGLAKSLESGPAHSMLDTMTKSRPLTAHGSVVGTVQYMSPEQLEGREADARSDVFALGAVLYEMATGVPPFAGKTPASVIAAILTSEPAPMGARAPTAPPALERIVRSCLAKDPDDRWQTAHDVRLGLEAIRDGVTVEQAAAVPARRVERAAWLLAVLIGIAGGILLGLNYLGRAAPAQTARYVVSLPSGTDFQYAALSPNGKMLALVGVSLADGTARIWTRPIDTLQAQPLAGTDGVHPGGAAMSGVVFWSPDSQSIGFFAQGHLKVIDAHGGPPQTLCAAAGQNSGTWSSDGTILFAVAEAAADNGLYRIPAAGGTPEKLHLTDGSGRPLANGFWPRFLPDGRHFLFVGYAAQTATRTLSVGVLGDAATAAIMSSESRVEYAAPGYLLWVREGTLLAQPFDASRQRLSGRPVTLGDGVTSFAGTGNANFSASQTGALIYEQAQGRQVQLVRLDREGRQGDTLGEPLDMESGSLSPSGSSLALSMKDRRSGNQDLWIADLDRKVKMRFTAQKGSAFGPVWSPDGRQLVFSADWDAIPHLFLQSIGAAQASVLLAPTGNVQIATDWSADGRFIIYMERSPTNDFDVWALPLSGDKKRVRVAATKFFEGEAALSPDGRWIAYTSDESGEREVYVQAFEGSGERRRISTNGGSSARWRRDGKELFYLAAGTLTAVAVIPGDRLAAGAPYSLFKMAGVDSAYEALADGQHFIEARSAHADVNRLPIVVVNWPDALAK